MNEQKHNLSAVNTYHSMVVAVANAIVGEPDLIFMEPGLALIEAIRQVAQRHKIVAVYHQHEGVLTPIPGLAKVLRALPRPLLQAQTRPFQLQSRLTPLM